MEVNLKTVSERIDGAGVDISRLSKEWDLKTVRDIRLAVDTALIGAGVSPHEAREIGSSLKSALDQLEESLTAAWRAAGVTTDLVNDALRLIKAKGGQTTVDLYAGPRR